MKLNPSLRAVVIVWTMTVMDRSMKAVPHPPILARAMVIAKPVVNAVSEGLAPFNVEGATLVLQALVVRLVVVSLVPKDKQPVKAIATIYRRVSLIVALVVGLVVLVSSVSLALVS